MRANRDFVKIQHYDDEIHVMNLVWQGLYGCQDEDQLRRGQRYYDFFQVWRKGKAYKVYVIEDEYEENITKEIYEEE